MINEIKQSKHMKKIYSAMDTYELTLYICSFWTFFKIYRKCLKHTLYKKKLNDFIVISVDTCYPNIYFDFMMTKKPRFSVYLSLLIVSHKIYKAFKNATINIVTDHSSDIYTKRLYGENKTDGLYVYLNNINFYNLYET